jgi:predicted RND superfamily exporter protein
MTLISVFFVFKLEPRLTLLDLFPDDLPSKRVALEIQEKFGGFGDLILIAEGEDPEANLNFIKTMSTLLDQETLVNFTEFKTESDFYRKHKLLYIGLKDLETIRNRISKSILDQKIRNNPLIVILEEKMESEVDTTTQLVLEDLEKKYLESIQDYLGTPDQKVMILKIYPQHDVTDIEQSNKLYQKTRDLIQKANPPNNMKIHFAGEIYRNILNEGKILNEIKQWAVLSLLFITLCLLIFFFRQPLIPILTLLPLFIGLLWTLAFVAITFGSLNIFSIVLGIILLGLGSDSVIHLLSRYGEERRKGLGVEIAFENIILETGPAISVSAFTSMAAFFAMSLIPFDGFSQFGIMAGAGMFFIWINVMLTFPAMLLVLQRRKLFKVLGKRVLALREFERIRFPVKRFFAFPLIITILMLISGLPPVFEYDFGKLEFPDQNPRAMELLEQSGELIGDPAVVLTPNKHLARRLEETLRKKMRTDSSPTIERIATFSSLLPADQEAKIEILDEIQSMLTPEVVSRLEGTNLKNVQKLQESWDVEEITEDELPLNYKRKFLGRNNNESQFSFIFPSINTSNGRECRSFATDVREIKIDSNTVFYTTGRAILQADLLDQTLPYMAEVVYTTLAIIFLLLLLHTNRLHFALMVMLPASLGFLWLLGLMSWFDIPRNSYNAIIFPLMIGISIDGSIHLFQRYKEEKTGSIFFVLKRTGSSVVVASMTSVAGFLGIMFSGHPGLRSMGIVAILGIVCILVANLSVFPVLAGLLERQKNRKLS